MLESLFNKVEELLKRDSNAGFSCKICENFKNTYFEEHLRTTNCFSDLKHGILVFYNIIFFSIFPNSKVNSEASIKIQTMGLVLKQKMI